MIPTLLALLALSERVPSGAPAVQAPEPAPAAPAAPPALDRTRPPPVAPATAMSLPEPERHPFGEGGTAQLVRVPGIRKVQLTFFLHQGSIALCGAPAAACDELPELMIKASTKTPSGELEAALDRLDAELDATMGLRDTRFTLAVPPENLDPALDLLLEVLSSPALADKDLKLDRRDRLFELESLLPSDIDQVARMALDHGWFPADTPYGARPDLAGWKKLKRADLVALHSRLMAEAPVTLVAVGDLSWADLEPHLSARFATLGAAGTRADPAPLTPPSAPRVIGVDMPGQPQAAVRLRLAAPPIASPDQPTFHAVHYALGGAFNARINLNLREEKGWTYGARTRYRALPAFGVFDVIVDVAAENAAATVQEINGELKRMVEGGPTDAELSNARQDALQTWNTRLLTGDAALGFYADLFDRGLSVGGELARMDSLSRVDPAAAKAQAGQIFAGPALWVVVGDRAVLEPQLQASGVTATWVTPEQAVQGQL